MGARNKALDVLRAIAVFMTFGRHMAEPGKELPGAAYAVLHAWFKTGWAGVSLFFVLSGFLVSSLMFNEFANTGGIRFGRFYIRRGLKIYPAFYVMLAFSLLLAWAGPIYFQRELTQHKLETQTVWAEIFFLQNYLGYIWVHVWSLAVEEHFYILLGILIWLALKTKSAGTTGAEKNPLAAVPWICLLVLCTCPLLRYYYLTPVSRSMDERFAGTCFTHLRIDSLFFGVLLAYFAKFHSATFLPWVKTHSWWLLGAGLLLISPSLRYEETDTFMFVPGFSLMHAGFGCLLMFTLYHDWKPAGGALGHVVNALAYIGQNSYSVYLWHFPVMFLIGLYLPSKGTAAYFTLISIQNLAGLIVGLVMAKIIEMPVLKIRDRMFASGKALNAGV